MIKRILPFALAGAALISNTGCKSGGSGDGEFKQLKGIEYKIIKDAPGKNAAIGDIVEFHILVMAGDSVLNDSRKQQDGKPAVARVDSVRGSAQFQAIFPMLSAGDSAIVHISCDSILANVPPENLSNLPPFIAKGKKLVFNVAVVAIKSMEEYQKDMQAQQEKMQQEMMEKAAAQLPVDDKLLQEYFAKNNIKATKTASGMYYTISKEGSGATAKAGQMVSMKYLGKTLDGQQFDANMDENYALLKDKSIFTFPLGQGQVIKGWDEGVQLLKKGTKATFYIPSPLAYGAQSMGPNLPANSILVFNVELVDMKEGGAAPQPMPGPAN